MASIQDEALGFVYLSEQTSFNSELKNINTINDNGIFIVEFDACLHSFDVLNRNNRLYESKNIWDCIMTEKIQSLLRDNLWAGESDHPTPEYKDKPLSAERIQSIWLPNRSHLITNPRIQGDKLNAHIKTFPNAVGTDFAKEIIALNAVPEFSCRSIASMQLKCGKPTVSVRRLITYDRVLYPSHREATAINTPKAVIKKVKTITESTVEHIKEATESIVIPLKEILETVGKTDVNAQMIMESFELNYNDMIGFDNGNNHLIIKDNDNRIYCKISPETKHKVDDFFASF